MRYECKYCGKNFTHLILLQMEGKITRDDVLNYRCNKECEREKQKNNN